ncbi:MAG: hypothetical protein KAJ81_00595 [Candidatus Latescibacteria bacterium]|nr:hypothetical protein [Candidatus Latescibacterota bacterium]
MDTALPSHATWVLVVKGTAAALTWCIVNSNLTVHWMGQATKTKDGFAMTIFVASGFWYPDAQPCGIHGSGKHFPKFGKHFSEPTAKFSGVLDGRNRLVSLK